MNNQTENIQSNTNTICGHEQMIQEMLQNIIYSNNKNY